LETEDSNMPVLSLVEAAAAAEDFGDEIVVIDASSGAFYSIKGRAMAVWRACARGLDLASLERAMSQLDAGERQVLDGMVSDLHIAGILAHGETAAGGDRLAWDGYAPALFEKNDDFNDLIRLDPIHDVTDQGWPNC